MTRNKNIFAFFLSLLFTGYGLYGQNYVSRVWCADNGDGTYKNPIIHADYSDPDVCSAGPDYYMTASSFTCSPGLPVLHSKDLVNWELINHALKKQVPEDVFNQVQQMKGVWAPAIRYHNNEFYIYYGDPDYGIYMVKTKDPAGVWEKPVLVASGKGLIDPCPFWDDDGNAYLAYAYAGSRAKLNSVLAIFKMNAEGTKVIDDGKIVYDGHDFHHTIEGPKLFKRNGFYYIFAPAGGVTWGWQLVLRSNDIYGPYEEKIVIDQGSTEINGPHQGAWVETQTGENWFIHFQDKSAYGRVVHLQPMTWKNDWPIIGIDDDGDGTGEPVLTFKKPDVGRSYAPCTPPESDEFSSDTPGLQWQWNANPRTTWYSLVRGKPYLRLYSLKQPDSHVNFWDVPNVLLQKFPAPDFTATTKVQLTSSGEGTQTGLIVLGRDYARLSFEKVNDKFKIALIECIDADKQGKETTVVEKMVNDSTLTLRVQVSSPDAICNFSYSENGKDFKVIGKPFKARQGGWMGAKTGIYSMAHPWAQSWGHGDFDWFRISDK